MRPLEELARQASELKSTRGRSTSIQYVDRLGGELSIVRLCHSGVSAIAVEASVNSACLRAAENSVYLPFHGWILPHWADAGIAPDQ